MKSFIAISLCYFSLTHSALGQGQEAEYPFLGPSFFKIIELYTDEQYDKLDVLMRFHGYVKKEVVTYHTLIDVMNFESFTYINKKVCQSRDQCLRFSTEVTIPKGSTTPNKEYYIRRIFYSSVCQSAEEKEVENYLSSYASNFMIPVSEGCVEQDRWISTYTPEYVKRSGDLYLDKGYFFIQDGKEYTGGCDMNYRYGCDMHFRKGFASLDSIGYVSTKEGSNLRLRDGPSLNANIITGIPDKSKVSILEYSTTIDIVNEESGNWYKIKYDGKTGWVWGNFIRNENDH